MAEEKTGHCIPVTAPKRWVWESLMSTKHDSLQPPGRGEEPDLSESARLAARQRVRHSLAPLYTNRQNFEQSLA